MIEDGARTEWEGRKRLTSLFHEVDPHSANYPGILQNRLDGPSELIKGTG